MYLNCKTYFSFRYGTYATRELVETGAQAGAGAMALTNINSTCDLWDFVQCCRENGIKPIAGVEIRNGHRLMYLLLAANQEGLAWIHEFLSRHLISETAFPDDQGNAPFFNNPADGFVIYPLSAAPPAHLLPNELIGVTPWEVNRLYGWDLKLYRDRLVVRQPVTFQNKAYYNAHRLLRAIDQNILLSKLSPAEQADARERLVPPIQLLEAFKQYPFIITNTWRIADTCHIDMDFHTDKTKKIFSASQRDDRSLLQKLAFEGLEARYGMHHPEAGKRVVKELQIIDQLGFNAYFLITWDIIRYAQNRGFYYVGRGSGANSIVAYCLRITDVDPIELDLYFERFLNPHRSSPPDFDIDFSWLDRDEVIDYIFKRYGEAHVSLLGSYATFQFNAIVRELGKVFGLPKAEIDAFGEKGYYYGSSRSDGFQKKNEPDSIHRLILQYGRLINNFPNHLSIHAGGMLISEKPLCYYTATHLPPKGFISSQIDMHIAENIGLYKLDILSQRGLGHIRETIRLVKENRKVEIQIHEVEKFKQDPVVRKQIRNVNTIGCFYIESPAMRQLLKKLECDDYLTLVAASSIIRPGVASSGMMREYIQRYHHPDQFTYLHPLMKSLLEETFGVMVFQEDVIKVAHYFAGLDMGEADILRRAMSGKYRGNKEMQRIREKFFNNCIERGYPDAISREVWRQIESFAGYSFSKAHSASFAVESFQDLFLKAYYPMEFMVGVINNFGGFYPTSLYFFELMKTGASLHLPCVNRSEYLTHIRGRDVFVGLIHIRDLEKKLAELIPEERKRNGPYQNITDLIERTGITKESLNTLINIGALRFTGRPKKKLLWEANFLVGQLQVSDPSTQSLFHEKPKEFILPDLADHPMDDLFDEVEILGFPLRNPFEMVDDDPAQYLPARAMPEYLGRTITLLTYFIAHKVVPTKTNQVMSFGTFLDADLNWVDTVHFPDAYRRQPLQGAGFYRITGKVVADFGVCSLEVSEIKKLGYKERRYSNL